jgi:hypothetical protein
MQRQQAAASARDLQCGDHAAAARRRRSLAPLTGPHRPFLLKNAVLKYCEFTHKGVYPFGYSLSVFCHTHSPPSPPTASPTYTLRPAYLEPKASGFAIGAAHCGPNRSLGGPCTHRLRTKSPDTMTESVASEWRILLLRCSAKTRWRKLDAEPFKSAAGETLVVAQLCKQPRKRANRTGLARCFFPFAQPHASTYYGRKSHLKTRIDIFICC